LDISKDAIQLGSGNFTSALFCVADFSPISFLQQKKYDTLLMISSAFQIYEEFERFTKIDEFYKSLFPEKDYLIEHEVTLS